MDGCPARTAGLKAIPNFTASGRDTELTGIPPVLCWNYFFDYYFQQAYHVVVDESFVLHKFVFLHIPLITIFIDNAINSLRYRSYNTSWVCKIINDL